MCIVINVINIYLIQLLVWTKEIYLKINLTLLLENEDISIMIFGTLLIDEHTHKFYVQCNGVNW